MSSGMNTEQAKEYAKTMTYSEAVSNVRYGKGIKYRKATMIKLRELAEIADRYDRKTEPQTEEPSFTATDFGKGTITRYTDEPHTETEIVLDPSFAELSEEQFAEAMKLIEPQTERSE